MVGNACKIRVYRLGQKKRIMSAPTRYTRNFPLKFRARLLGE
jgi:hypothetical protein